MKLLMTDELRRELISTIFGEGVKPVDGPQMVNGRALYDCIGLLAAETLYVAGKLEALIATLPAESTKDYPFPKDE